MILFGAMGIVWARAQDPNEGVRREVSALLTTPAVSTKEAARAKQLQEHVVKASSMSVALCSMAAAPAIVLYELKWGLRRRASSVSVRHRIDGKGTLYVLLGAALAGNVPTLLPGIFLVRPVDRHPLQPGTSRNCCASTAHTGAHWSGKLDWSAARGALRNRRAWKHRTLRQDARRSRRRVSMYVVTLFECAGGRAAGQ